ncbi:MAG: histidine kinase [Frankiales bacterium]|nr:histidine kinase [Frankiales bacterium]
MTDRGTDLPGGLPASTAGVTRNRRRLALLGFVVVLPALTSILVSTRAHLSYATPVLLVLLLVVLVALVGGLRVALPASLAGGLVLNWFFTPPYNTLVVDRADHIVVLGVYLAVAVAVSTVVDLAARRTAEAARARAEAQALASLAGAALSEQQTLPDLLEQVRVVFGMRSAALLEQDGSDWVTVTSVDGGTADARDVAIDVPAGPGLLLRVRGAELFAEDRRVLASFAEAAATALEGRRLAERATEAAELEAADRVRTALLAAVGHDLRTPLAGIKAAVSSLRQTDMTWTASDRDAFLETIEESSDRLQALVANLLDASRLRAGAFSAVSVAVGLVEAVDAVLLSLPPPDRDRLLVELPTGLPDAMADPGLLERVLANLVDNALRHTPSGTFVTVTASLHGPEIVCDVIDHGPGISPVDRSRAFAPFQRLDDRTPGGVGLGLSVARGFAEAMHAAIVPRETPGGGLTMRLTLPLAPNPNGSGGVS